MFATREDFISAYKRRCTALLSKSLADATSVDKYVALASMIREAMSEKWVNTNDTYLKNESRQVYYFSLEFLIGKFLETNMQYLGVEKICSEGLEELGISLEELIECEPDAGLGNGGLGRLAACFLDSLAALGYPGHGCGIRYKYGLFKQQVIDGYQVELPDNWLRLSNPWELRKPEKAVLVKMGGNAWMEPDENGNLICRHEGFLPVVAVPYDMPVLGAQNNTVNTLRLWSAESPDSFDFAMFSRGEYVSAISNRYEIEAISEVLYPDDSNYKNRLLRLKQQYFFVSAGIQSIVRRFKKKHEDIRQLPELIAIHINDTHPALAVPELMRILMDDEYFSWDEAWDITTKVIAYTNHTIMPEALEKWPVPLFRELLPRIYMIVEEIDRRFRQQLNDRYHNDTDKINWMSIIADSEVRMANLAVVGSYSVNGVAAVHTELLKHVVMRDHYDFAPHKFNNKTNGITHRRWLLKANPDLTDMISEAIGDGWKRNPASLSELMRFRDDASIQEKLHEIKRLDKERLADYIKRQNDIIVDPDSIFDVQIKRIHAYKRQHLNALHIQHLYNKLLDNPDLDIQPHTFIFAGKAAPSYYFAKTIIKYISELAVLIDNHPKISQKLKVVFLENYNVGLAELIFPASDVSEQISTASKEASGTGNMKFMLNGAVTIGTNDGANIEIRERVGDNNFVLFGYSVEAVVAYLEKGGYDAREFVRKDPRIARLLTQLDSGTLFPNVPREDFQSIVRNLVDYNDQFFLLGDFDSYVRAHERVDMLYRKKPVWGAMSLTNIAMAGYFSSDITIEQYAKEIWRLEKCDPGAVI